MIREALVKADQLILAKKQVPFNMAHIEVLLPTLIKHEKLYKYKKTKTLRKKISKELSNRKEVKWLQNKEIHTDIEVFRNCNSNL